MATIEKRQRASGTTYRVKVRIKGFPPQEDTFKRLTDAKKWAQDTEAAIRRGEYKFLHRQASGKTLKDVVDRVRSDLLPGMTPATRVTEGSYLDFWEDALGKYALTYITPDLIREKIVELEQTPVDRRKDKSKPRDTPAPMRSRRTVKHYRDALERMLKQAVKWEWLGSSPMDAITPITKIKDSRNRYLDDQERDALLKACRASSSKSLYPVVLLALSTGARKGEILGLLLRDVDMTRGRAILRDTKNGDTRSVAIIDSVRALLADHIAEVNAFYDKRDVQPESRWLFPSKNGLGSLDIRRPWTDALAAAGITDFRFHDLRHSTASYLAMNGASLVEIAEVLGHRTLQMVRRYAHLSEGHVTDLVKRVNAKVLGETV